MFKKVPYLVQDAMRPIISSRDEYRVERGLPSLAHVRAAGGGVEREN